MVVKVRDKGHNGEREICAILTEYLGMKIERNVDQVRSGGADIVMLKPFSIEVKRQERLNINAWWKQAQSQKTKTNPVPILMFRQNRLKWRVMIEDKLIVKKRFRKNTTIEITMEHFLFIAGLVCK